MKAVSEERPGEAPAGAVEVQAKWKKLSAWEGPYTLFLKDLTML